MSASRPKNAPTVLYPRAGTPADADGYPHYGPLQAVNQRLCAAYTKILAQRRRQRQALVTNVVTPAGKTAWKKHVATLRVAIAGALGLSISTARTSSPACVFMRGTTMNAFAPDARGNVCSISARWYRMPSAGWDGTAIDLLFLRSSGDATPRPAMLLLPDSGASLVGSQSPETVAAEWGCQLAAAGFCVCIPTLPAMTAFSSTRNKARLLEGGCALGDVAGEAAAVLAVLLAQSDIAGRTAWVGGTGVGGLVSLFLGVIDGRVGGVLADAPLTWGEINDAPALVVPRSRPLTDLQELCAALAPLPLVLVAAPQKLSPFTAAHADVKHLARAALAAYRAEQSTAAVATFTAGKHHACITWLVRHSTAMAARKPRLGRTVRSSGAQRHFSIRQYSTAAQRQRDVARFRRQYKDLVGIPQINQALRVEHIGTTTLTDAVRDEYHVHTGANTIANVVLLTPRGTPRRRPTILCLPGSTSDVAKVERHYAHEVIADGWNACIIDARVALYPFHPGIAEGQAVIAQSLHDLLCCLDWVAGLDHVDPHRIGTMGVSQGGTHSWMLAAMDDRIAACAPICGFCTYTSLITNHVSEWYGGALRSFLDSHSMYYFTPGVLALAEQQDLCSLIAPRPLCIIGGTHDDCFPLDGMRAGAKDLRHAYRLTKAPRNFEYREFEGPHDMPASSRKVAYGFFRRHFGG